MTSSQTNLTSHFGLTIHKPGSHCSIAMWNSFFMPSSKAQAKKWIGYVGDWDRSQVIGSQLQVCQIEEFMAKHGVVADFKYTKSKSFVRLANFQDFINCVKKEFQIK